MNPITELLADLEAAGVTLALAADGSIVVTSDTMPDERLSALIQEHAEALRALLAPKPETLEDHIAALTRDRDFYSFPEIVCGWFISPN